MTVRSKVFKKKIT